MFTATQVFVVATLVAAAATAVRVELSTTSADGERRPLPGVYRATYKEPRPVRSSARNLARDEAIMPPSDRISRSSSPSQTSPLVTRLLLERQSHDVGDASHQGVTHSVSTSHDAHGSDKQGERPFSYQQYDIDTSLEEHQLQGHLPQHEGDGHEEDGGEVRYQYMYQVAGTKEGDGDYGHAEARDGHKTWGRYFVNQPDGRIKTVRYWADKTGYHAKVEFHGEAEYPDKQSQAAEYEEH